MLLNFRYRLLQIERLLGPQCQLFARVWQRDRLRNREIIT